MSLSPMHPRLRLPIALLLCATGPALAVDIQGVLPAAMDQPQINAYLSLPGNDAPLTAADLGIDTFNITGYLDTGASGVLISEQTAIYLDLGGFSVPVQLLKPDDVEYDTYFNTTTQQFEPVIFHDVGVGGTAQFGVSKPINVSLAPFAASTVVDDLGDLSAYVPVASPVRLQLGPVPEHPDQPPLSEFADALSGLDVFGMPVMTGKVVVMDARPVNQVIQIFGGLLDDPNADIGDFGDIPSDLLDLNMRTSVVAHSPGQYPVTTHNIMLSYGDFTPYTSTIPDETHAPTLASNPFIGPNPLRDPSGPADNTPPVTLRFGTHHTTASLLLDTGAAASMISTKIAGELGVRYRDVPDGADPELETFDPNNSSVTPTLIPNQFHLTIQGIGGVQSIAGFYLDEMILRTLLGDTDSPLTDALNDPARADDIAFLGAPVLVYDIAYDGGDPLNPNDDKTLDGVFGMNFLVGSADFDMGTDGFPIFNGLAQGAFGDIVFNDPEHYLGLNFVSAAVPEPSSVAFGLAAIGIMALGRRRKNPAAAL